MIITQLQGNLNEAPLPEGTHLETVSLAGPQLVKRIQRLTTDHGREFGLRLPPGSPDLVDGDILCVDQTGAVVVRVAATDVIVIKARSIAEMAVTAHTLGNRHLPAQFFGVDSEYGAEVMVVAYDHTVEDYLLGTGVPFERVQRELPTPFRHAEHTH